LKSKYVSIKDVAKITGLSPGTVSRALSRPEMVKEVTRKRILDTVSQLGYVTNGVARALVNSKSYTVGAVIPRFGSATFSTMLQTLESSLEKGGYRLLLSMPEISRVNEPSNIRTLIESGIDALVLLGALHPPETLAIIQNRNIPVVTMWSAVPGPLPGVHVDEQAGAFLIINHLASLGHQKIAFISGVTQNNERAAQRLRGIQLAVIANRMTLDEANIIETRYGFEEGFKAALALVDRSHDITAIVCGNDYLATGALSALKSRGIRVPQDISVTGINDNDYAAYLNPSLTTISIPFEQIGQTAAKYLIEVLKGNHTPNVETHELKLVVRESTGQVRKNNLS